MLLHLLVLLARVTCSPEVCCAHLPSAGPRACRCPPVHSASVVSSPKEELGGLRENQEQGLRENQERGLRENQERGLRENQGARGRTRGAEGDWCLLDVCSPEVGSSFSTDMVCLSACVFIL